VYDFISLPLCAISGLEHLNRLPYDAHLLLKLKADTMNKNTTINLVRMARFWNNLLQIRSKLKYLKAKKFKRLRE
jgi:hypothetical protein